MRGRFLIFFFFSLTISIFAQGTWDTLGPSHCDVRQVIPDPNSPDSVYIVSAEMVTSGNQLMRSVDLGHTWDTLGNYYAATLHPSTAETLFAALSIGSFSDGFWRSNAYGNVFDHMASYWFYMPKGISYDQHEPDYVFGYGSGITRSTNGGADWVTVYSSPGIVTYFIGVEVDPYVGHRVYAISDGGELLVSTDHGRHWERLWMFPEGYNPNDIALNAIDSNHIYLATWRGVSISADCGSTWNYIDIPSGPTNCIWVSPTSAENIVVGGPYGLLMSGDMGHTWEPVADSLRNEVLCFATGVGDGSSDYWYVGTSERGVFRTEAIYFTEGPYIREIYPPESSWVSLDTFHISIEAIDPDGVDSSTIELVVEGVAYHITDPELEFSDDEILFAGDFDLVDTIEISLNSMDDMVGNPCAALPVSWRIFLDRISPEMTYCYPDSGEQVADTNITAKFYFQDIGSGLDSTAFSVSFNSIMVDIASLASIVEADTYFVNLPAAGVGLSDGDTVHVELCIGDSPDIGEANLSEKSWDFFVEMTGIAESRVPINKGLSVYPNPFNSACKIETPPGSKIEIYDIEGKNLFSTVGSEALWNPDLSVVSGVYLIRIENQGKYARKKVIYIK